MLLPNASQALEMSPCYPTYHPMNPSLQPYVSQALEMSPRYLVITPNVSQALEMSTDVGASMRKLAVGWAVPSLQPWGYAQASLEPQP